MVQLDEVVEAPSFSPLFEEWLKTILAGYGGFDKDTQKGVEDGMRKLYTNCKFLDHLRDISNKEIDTKEDYRRFFFFPSVYDMKHYAVLFASKDSEHMKLKFHASCVFYLAHSHEVPLLRQFVLDGGISAVSKNLEDDNMFARSQHFEVLMRALALMAPGSSDPSSLWFPTGPDGKKANAVHDSQEAILFSCLRDALTEEHLLPSLFAMISIKSDCFPNSLVQCLQLFHFTLNWLQFHYTEKDQRLKLPSSWHNLIKSLTSFPDMGIVDAAHQWLNMFDCLESHNDFSNSWLGLARQLKAQKVLPIPKIEKHTADLQRFGVYKKLGNGAFKGKRYDNALPAWEKALDYTTIPKDIGILHSNMSQVYLTQGKFDEACKAAEASIGADDQNFKAFYRWAQAEENRGNLEMAVTKGKAALNVDPENEEILKFTERVQAIWER